MKREPSAYSYVKNLAPGEAVTIPGEKLYAVKCAIAYIAEEYGWDLSISTNQDGETIIVTRNE